MSTAKSLLIPAASLLLAVLIWIGWAESHQPQPTPLTPTLTGQTEYCLTCHADLPQISPSHPVEVFGCVRCHGGERLALDEDLAHSTMRGGKNPSDPAVVEASCGGEQCHSGPAITEQNQIQRLELNLHTTYAGAISAVRLHWGVQSDAQAHQSVVAAGGLELFDPTQESAPQAQTFAKNCLNCHLAAAPLPGQVYARGTGCAACHIEAVNARSKPSLHRLTTGIAYQQCNTCHFRGEFHLDTLQFIPRSDQGGSRRVDYYPPGTPAANCEYRLDCVDCHTRHEAMGDGHLESNQAEARYAQCKTCHGTLDSPPLTTTLTSPDELALRLAALNPAVHLQVGDTILVTERGEPLWNIRQLPDGSFEETGKASGQHFRLPLVAGSGCQQRPDQQEAKDCHVCHANEK